MKKFDYKLAVCFASLFASCLLLFIGAKNKYSVGFGLILLGASIGFFAYHQISNINKTLKATEADLDEYYMENKKVDQELISEIYQKKQKLKKTRVGMMISFSISAVLLVVFGLFMMV